MKKLIVLIMVLISAQLFAVGFANDKSEKELLKELAVVRSQGSKIFKTQQQELATIIQLTKQSKILWIEYLKTKQALTNAHQMANYGKSRDRARQSKLTRARATNSIAQNKFGAICRQRKALELRQRKLKRIVSNYKLRMKNIKKYILEIRKN